MTTFGHPEHQRRIYAKRWIFFPALRIRFLRAPLLMQPAQSLFRHVFTFPALEVVPRNACFGSDDQ